jgi:hypothetical protein
MKKRRKERKLMRHELTHRSERVNYEKEKDPIQKKGSGPTERILVV